MFRSSPSFEFVPFGADETLDLDQELDSEFYSLLPLTLWHFLIFNRIPREQFLHFVGKNIENKNLDLVKVYDLLLVPCIPQEESSPCRHTAVVCISYCRWISCWMLWFSLACRRSFAALRPDWCNRKELRSFYNTYMSQWLRLSCQTACWSIAALKCPQRWERASEEVVISLLAL